MMTKNFPHYLQTSGKTRIFFNTNFDHRKPTREQLAQPLLVFNYGLVCSNYHWSKQVPYFDRLGWRVLIHNYRGHFNSSGQEDLESCNFTNIAEDIKYLLDYLEAPSCFMLGHSMGVNITLEFAKLYQESLQGMVLISGTVLPPAQTMFDSNIMEWIIPAARALSQKYPEAFQKAWQISPLVPLFQKMILYGGFNPQRVSLDFIQKYMNRIGQLPPQLFFHLFEGMGTHQIRSHLKAIHVPGLIIGGEKDKVVPNHFQEILKEDLARSEFYLVKDGSHVPQVDFPELINERISAFIQKFR